MKECGWQNDASINVVTTITMIIMITTMALIFTITAKAVIIAN